MRCCSRSGQLGLGDTSDALLPMPVTGALKGKVVVQLAAGAEHTVCVTIDGSVYSWGDGSDGQLGLDDTADRAVPTPIGGQLYGATVTQVRTHTGGNHRFCL